MPDATTTRLTFAQIGDTGKTFLWTVNNGAVRLLSLIHISTHTILEGFEQFWSGCVEPC